MIFSNLFYRYNSRYSKKQNGITLVALVVTIVVLLILAGITITVLFGDNGIIKSAQKAKTETERDQGDTENGLANLTEQMLQALGEPITKKEHTKANLTATADDGDIKGMKYTWSDLYNVSKAISKTTVADDVREITVEVNGTNYTVGIGDEATVYYGTTAKKVRLIGFNHDTVVDSKYGAPKAGMTFEFVDSLGDNHPMNPSDATHKYGTNENGWAATEMRKYLNGYTTSDAVQNGEIDGEAAKIKEASGGSTLKIQKVKKDYIKTYNSPNLNGGTSTELMSGTPSQDYLWLLSCAEIWSDGSQTTGKGNAMGVEGSQYAFYKDATAGVAYNLANPKIVKSSSGWWLRSPDYRERRQLLRYHPKWQRQP